MGKHLRIGDFWGIGRFFGRFDRFSIGFPSFFLLGYRFRDGVTTTTRTDGHSQETERMRDRCGESLIFADFFSRWLFVVWRKSAHARSSFSRYIITAVSCQRARFYPQREKNLIGFKVLNLTRFFQNNLQNCSNLSLCNPLIQKSLKIRRLSLGKCVDVKPFRRLCH